ncbi:MAG: hypothetical protein PGN20_14535 [Agrobacterium cavarae]
MPRAWRKGNGGKVFTLTRCSATSVIGKRHNHDTSSIEQPSSGVTARILILKGNEKWAGLSHSFLRVRRWLFWQVRSWLRARLPRARPVALLPMGLTHAQRAPSLRSEVDGPDGRCVKRLSARRENPGRFFIAAAQGCHERIERRASLDAQGTLHLIRGHALRFPKIVPDFRALAVVQRSIKVTLKKLRLLFRAEAAL